MGMRSAFSNRANFSGMLGKSKTPVKLENVFQSVGIVIDETGGEAVAATAAVMAPKSIRIKPMPDCKVDRPFVFAVVHTASGAPLFMGAVSMPQVAKE
jgi:serpin B